MYQCQAAQVIQIHVILHESFSPTKKNVAAVTGIDEILIQRFAILLGAVSQSSVIDFKKFDMFATDKAIFLCKNMVGINAFYGEQIIHPRQGHNQTFVDFDWPAIERSSGSQSERHEALP
jgi:hypothetical protein